MQYPVDNPLKDLEISSKGWGLPLTHKTQKTPDPLTTRNLVYLSVSFRKEKAHDYVEHYRIQVSELRHRN